MREPTGEPSLAGTRSSVVDKIIQCNGGDKTKNGPAQTKMISSRWRPLYPLGHPPARGSILGDHNAVMRVQGRCQRIRRELASSCGTVRLAGWSQFPASTIRGSAAAPSAASELSEAQPILLG
jgi:hypothetical protein